MELINHLKFKRILVILMSVTVPLASVFGIGRDTTFDVRFYHLNIAIEVNSPYISGDVFCRFSAQQANLSQIRLDFTDSLTVDSITGNIASFSHTGNLIEVNFANPLNRGDLDSIRIYYHGVPPLAYGYKGLRYEQHNGNEPIIASLSTPFLAHFWWPCKDGPEDKADSVYIDISIPDTVINGLPLVAVSNGTLDTIRQLPGRKQFCWRERYPIVTYYVMAAISNYQQYTQQYSDSLGNSFPIDYYYFREDSISQVSGVASMPAVMDFFTNLFGPYPFRQEKYGMAQLGYYSGIENQTMTIINSMASSWMGTSVHELAHMWFADAITCSEWGHGWLNEGFATYCEALWLEHSQGMAAYHTEMSGNQYFQRDTLFLNPVSDPLRIFVSVIYQKGAYVLHMLRKVMGDQAFFQAMKAYASDPAHLYGHASTEDFQSICESFYGSSLGFFFQQWIYDADHPLYEYWYVQDPQTYEVEVRINQLQGTIGRRPVFEMPVDLRLFFAAGGDTTITVWNDSVNQSFRMNPGQPVSQVALDPDRWILRKTTLVSSIEKPQKNAWTEFELYPNPASEITVIKLNLSSSTKLDIEVLDVTGRVIKVLHQGKLGSGEQTIRWNGITESGAEVKNGWYFVRINSGKYAQTKSLVWLKN